MSEQVHVEQNNTQQVAAYVEEAARRNEQMNKAIDQYAGTGEMPEWYTDAVAGGPSITETMHTLDDEQTDPNLLLTYYHTDRETRRLSDLIKPRPYLAASVAAVLYNGVIPVSANRLGAGLKAENETGVFHADILTGLADDSMPIPELDILRGYYGLETMTDLFSVKGSSDFDNQIHDLLRSKSSLARTIRYKDAQKPKNDADYVNASKYTNQWMNRALAAATGLPETTASEYSDGLATRGFGDEDDKLLALIEQFDRFGAEKLQFVAKETGIHAFDAYTSEQLDRMVQLVENPQNVAEQLRDKDVTVVMINRVGDHNGVLRNSAADFEDDDESRTTLYFEINSMADIYRYAVKLKNWGVQPASIVLAAHSGEGQFMVTDERNPEARKRDIAAIASKMLITKINTEGTLDAGDYGYAIEAADGLRKIVDDYMKPSNLDGQKKIIFQACHAGSEANVADIDESGNKQSIGRSSVISKLAENLQKSGSESAVEIYGADGGIQLKRTEHGVRYTGQPVSMDAGRTAKSVKKMTLSHGSISVEDVDEIVLR